MGSSTSNAGAVVTVPSWQPFIPAHELAGNGIVPDELEAIGGTGINE